MMNVPTVCPASPLISCPKIWLNMRNMSTGRATVKNTNMPLRRVVRVVARA